MNLHRLSKMRLRSYLIKVNTRIRVAQKLVWRNSIESLDCIEKAILLVPNNEKYLN